MATNTYLAISDGSTTLTIADGSGGSVSGNYRLVDESWAPAVAGFQRSPFGELGSYRNVEESIEIAVSGSTVAACLSYINNLTALLNQAERWYMGETVNAVTLRYSPRGATVSSAASPLQAAILGASQDTPVTLPPTLEDGNTYKAGIRLNLARRGAWIYGSTSGSSSSTTYGSSGSVSLGGSTAHKSPTDIELTNYVTSNTSLQNAGFIIVSDQANKICILDANQFYSAGRFIDVAESGTYAASGSVLEYRPTATSWWASGDLNISSLFNQSARRIAVLISMKNESSTYAHEVNFELRTYSSGFQYFQTPTVVVPEAATPTPKWYMLGIVNVTTAITYCVIRVRTPNTSAYLRFDKVAIVDMDGSAIIEIDGYAAASVTGTLKIQQLSLSKPMPRAVVTYGADDLPVSWRSNIVLETSASSLHIAPLFVQGTAWNVNNGSAANSFVATVRRPTAYTSPV